MTNVHIVRFYRNTANGKRAVSCTCGWYLEGFDPEELANRCAVHDFEYPQQPAIKDTVEFKSGLQEDDRS